jgi:hypothetical protein
MFHIATPSGSWYFSGMPGERADEDVYEVKDDMFPPIESNTSDDLWWHKHENLHRTNPHVEKFRVVPREDTLHHFLAAFSKSASNMHALKHASLWAPLGGLVWRIAYSAPAQLTTLYGPPGIDQSPARQLWRRVGAWRPDASLHKFFQEIGAARHGGKMLEYWNVEEYGDVLLDLDLFEDSLAAFPRYDGVYPRMSLMKDWYLRRT